MPEYRLCIVTETIYPPHNTQGIIKHKSHKALFHQWIRKIAPHYNETPIMGGGFVIKEHIGNDEYLIAVVEYEDGTIHEHMSNEIQFTNGMAEKFSNDKKDNWNKLTEGRNSYPEFFDNVLFKTSDGRTYFGFCDAGFNWKIILENQQIYMIKDVVEWRAYDSI